MAQIGRHTSELQSPVHLVCRLLLDKKKVSLRCHHGCDPHRPPDSSCCRLTFDLSLSLVFFFSPIPPPPSSTLFPYTTLFRSRPSSCSPRPPSRSGSASL